MWRWSWVIPVRGVAPRIFSTYVEVIPADLKIRSTKLNFLHVCGGDPVDLRVIRVQFRFSPRMWRWSLGGWIKSWSSIIFSTYVEVIPTCWIHSNTDWYFLHVCGGDPYLYPFANTSWAFSPRMWRWSYDYVMSPDFSMIFSTYVEVILLLWVCAPPGTNFLHVCGGDPN